MKVYPGGSNANFELGAVRRTGSASSDKNRRKESSSSDAVADRSVANSLSAKAVNALKNVQENITLVQLTDTAWEGTQTVLENMRTLAAQSLKTDSSEDRVSLDKRLSLLKNEINLIAVRTENNGQEIMDDSDRLPTDESGIHLGTVDLSAFEIADLTVTEPNCAEMTVDVTSKALGFVQDQRAGLERIQQNLSQALHSINVGSSNLEAAQSVLDASRAREMVVAAREAIQSHKGLSAASHAAVQMRKNVNVLLDQ